MAQCSAAATVTHVWGPENMQDDERAVGRRKAAEGGGLTLRGQNLVAEGADVRLRRIKSLGCAVAYRESWIGPRTKGGKKGEAVSLPKTHGGERGSQSACQGGTHWRGCCRVGCTSDERVPPAPYGAGREDDGDPLEPVLGEQP